MSIFDVIVIGSGAGAGAAIPPLVERGLSVCVLERRPAFKIPRVPGEAPTSYLPIEPSNLVAGGDAPFILESSTVGGTTSIFSANLLRFAPADFRRHSLLSNVAGADLADWPLTYEELEPYYTEMEEEIGVGGAAQENPFEPPRSRPFPLPPLPYDSSGARCAAAARRLGWHPYPIPTGITPGHGRGPCLRCGPCTGYGCAPNARWTSAIALTALSQAGRISLRTGATVTRLVTDESAERVTEVEYLDESGAGHRVTGRTVVLAAGAVQTPRLLLQSANTKCPNGLGNGSGLVGRYLMTHSHEAFFAAGVFPDEETQPSSACTLAIQDFYDSARSGVPLPITLEPRSLGNLELWHRVVDMRESPSSVEDARAKENFRSNVVVLNMVEDLPQRQNRVELSSERRDRFGLPLPALRYQAHELDVVAARFAAARGVELLSEAGATGVFSIGTFRGPRLHVCGTCRMGHDPATSVVNSWGRSHEVRNLYVADASLFVTSGGVNPALTVAALARRMAVGLIGDLARRD